MSGNTTTQIKTQRPHLLSGANDWEILVDFEHQRLTFPPEICATDQRPDIVIWSRNSKTVILIELTCPSEENIEAAQVYKESRYLELCSLASDNGWKTHSLPVEAGARGFVSRSMNVCFRKLGFTYKSASSLCKSVSGVVARCSYRIWLNHKNKNWKKVPLLEPIHAWTQLTIFFSLHQSCCTVLGPSLMGLDHVRPNVLLSYISRMTVEKVLKARLDIVISSYFSFLLFIFVLGSAP